MSYGDSSLDLTSFSVACLSGLNGAGKSAILDAVTWALWESARSSSEELIRIGEQEMWVDLVFELEDHRYRVRRARQRLSARAGTRAVNKGTLEFQIWSGTDSTWRSLTAGSMRETQERINGLLRMDYDTFINSVYLRQGRADEFTTRAPSERKQVLAEILGLTYFDRLQAMAKEEARERRERISVLQQALSGSANVEQHLADHNQQLQHQASLLQVACEGLTQDCETLARIQNELVELQSLESRLQPSVLRLEELVADLQSLNASGAKHRKRRDQLVSILTAASELEDANRTFKYAKDKVEQLDRISLRRQEFETKQQDVRSQLAIMRGRMEVELEHLKEQRLRAAGDAQKLEQELTHKDQLTADYAAYRQLLVAEAQAARKQDAYTQLNLRAEQLHTLTVEVRIHLETELDHKKSLQTELHGLIENRNGIAREEADLNQQAAELDRLELEFEAVEENGLKLKQQIDGAQLQVQELQRRLVENDSKAKELQQAPTLTMCPLCASPIVDRVAVMARYEKTEAEIRSQIAELEQQTGLLEEKRLDLRQRYADLRRRLDSRKQLDRRIADFNARKSALERADANYEKISADIAEIERKLSTQDYAHLERESLIGIKAEIHKLEFDPVIYSSLQAQIRAQRHLEVRHQQMKRDLQELQKIQLSLPDSDRRIVEISRQLESNDFGGDLQEQMRALTEQLSTFDYDPIEHQALRQELARLLPLVERFREIDRARDELPLVEEELATLEASLQQKEDLKASLEASIAQWKTRLQSLPSLYRQKSALEQNIHDNQLQKHALGRQIAVLETKVENLEAENNAFNSKRAQLDELIAAMNDYEFLAETFGKKGIQAIIIENAVPEIEAEANNILSRLSDNQMHVALVTQHRTKSGVLQETLDIVIADELGTRNYELYSGGEAFKINFAIRVALSRLLARRAGAKLQSLIVDEGFGSQDELSRARLLKAIHAIKPDFAKILVVTHIAEIKEMFPVQIHVQKNNGMSTLNLVHAY